MVVAQKGQDSFNEPLFSNFADAAEPIVDFAAERLDAPDEYLRVEREDSHSVCAVVKRFQEGSVMDLLCMVTAKRGLAICRRQWVTQSKNSLSGTRRAEEARVVRYGRPVTPE